MEKLPEDIGPDHGAVNGHVDAQSLSDDAHVVPATVVQQRARQETVVASQLVRRTQVHVDAKLSAPQLYRQVVTCEHNSRWYNNITGC